MPSEADRILSVEDQDVGDIKKLEEMATKLVRGAWVTLQE